MTSVPNMGTGELVGTYWYLKPKKGNLYLVRVDIINGRRKETWLGNVEEIQKIITEYKQRNKRPYNKGWDGARRSLVADPGGFEPPTTGLGEQFTMTRSSTKQSGNSQNTLKLGPIPVWEIQPFLEYCMKNASKRTCQDYANYLMKPLDISKRWSVKAYRLYLKMKGEKIPEELKVNRGKPDLTVPSLDEIKLSLFKACAIDDRLCLVYKLLLESGARLSEIIYMLRRYKPELDKKQDSWLEYQINWHRGKKHSFIIFHLTLPNIGFNNTESWVSHQAIANNIVRPKYVRKFVATRMLELEIPRDAVNFIQGRVSEDVLATHYLDRLVLARRYYPRYAEWIRQLYHEIGIGGRRG